jgi:hypothetical protein
MKSETRRCINKYRFHDDHKTVDGFDNSLFQGRTQRQVEQGALVGGISAMGMVIVMFIVAVMGIVESCKSW